MLPSTSGIPSSSYRDLIRLATLAPSGHNTQPWFFTQGDRCIYLHPDHSRRLPVVDPDDHALWISLGCALENLAIATRCAGFSPRIQPQLATEHPVLSIYLEPSDTPPTPSDLALQEAISQRQSTRCAYDAREIPSDHLQRLIQASQQAGVQVRLFSTPDAMAPFIAWVREGNRQQFSDRAFVEELMQWIRFSRREVQRHQDGIPSRAIGIPYVPRWLGKQLMTWFATPQSQAQQFEQRIHQSSALLLFIADHHDRPHWVNLGRSFQRVALTATSLDLKHAHLNMPCEVVSVRSQMQQHFGLGDAQPLLLIRLGYANAMPRAPRRSLDAVIQTSVMDDPSPSSPSE